MDAPELRCFVAMAIGRSETDRLYDRQIKPVLRTLGIRPIFMGTLEHNDDIDNRIIEEIQRCDLAIADLTFARPSVYFEAGFAQRTVPVVYTCRSDHLDPKAEDNLRVHFDLHMKPKVYWRTLEDPTFQTRLRRRIAFVIKPLLRDRTANIARAREEREFGRLALDSRLESVGKVFRQALHDAGWRPILEAHHPKFWAGRLVRPHTLSLTALWVQSSITQKEIGRYVDYVSGLMRSQFLDPSDVQGWEGRRLKNPTAEELKGIRKLIAQVVLCSLEKIPRQRLTAALPSYAASHDVNAYEWDGSLPVSIRSTTQFGTRLIPSSVSVSVFDDIRSERVARDKARSISLAQRPRQRTT